MPLRFADDVRARLRRRLLAKGQQVASMLADVLAGGDPAAAGRVVAPRPGERVDEALRRYLELIESRRRLLDAGDDAFGRCVDCGEDLGITALGEMPWADRCPRHG